METYRIVRVTFVVGESWETVERFAVQRRTRLMWIGPYIWETYTAEYNFEDSWSYFIGNGEFYDTLEDANKVIEKLKIRHENWKINSVIAEHNYDEAENNVSCVKDGSEGNEGEKLYELRYTTASGKPFNPTDSDALNSLKYMGFVSNTAEDGICVMRFNKPITTLATRLFSYSDLTSIDIPDSVTSIEHGTFHCCKSLTSIDIPNNVTSIGHSIFLGCSKLSSITIPDSVKSIGSWTFTWCKNLTSITIPESVKSIGDYTFGYCIGLTSITIPNGVTSIGEHIFEGCDNLTEINYSGSVTGFPWGAKKIACMTSVDNNEDTVNDKFYELKYTTVSGQPFDTCNSNALNSLKSMGFVSNTVDKDGTCVMSFNKSITTIGKWLFCGSDLISIDIPESVTSIDMFAFYACSSLKSIVIHGSVTNIENSAFNCCSSLTSITIGNGVTSIGNSAFLFCSSLTSIVIPDSVTSIEGWSFAWCKNLTSIVIPDSVTSIGEHTFSGCDNLKEIHYSGSSTGFPWGAKNAKHMPSVDDNENTVNEKLYELRYTTASGKPVNIKDSDALNSLKSMGFVSNTEEDGICVMRFSKPIVTIGNSLFCNSDITSIDIPDSVISIKEDAFVCCRALTSITIPDSVTSIDKYAFYCCSNLTSITIGNGVSCIGNWVFAWCKNLTSITIPNNVMCIGNYAFAWCDNLTEIHYSGTATGFPWSAIKATLITDGNDNKDTVNDNDAVNDNDDAVNDNDDTVNEKLYELKYTTASGKPFNIESLDTLNNLKSKGLVSNTVKEDGTCVITFNKPITTICNFLFYSSDLTSIDIPDSVTSIDEFAFYNCPSLKSITIPDSVTSIGAGVFEWCSSLTSIIIPDSVTSIGNYTFSRCKNLTSITIPDSVTSIGECVFCGCDRLTSIQVESGNPVYDSRNDCNAIIETSTNTLISGCNNTIIPDSVTSIGDGAFKYCSSLESITIPDSVISIGELVFFGCARLKNITISDSVTSICKDTFGCCDHLTEIHYSGSASGFPWGAKNANLITGSDEVDNEDTVNEKLYELKYTTASGKPFNTKYKDALISLETMGFVSNTVENGTCIMIFNKPITTIGNSLFYDSDLTSIDIPDSVTSIEDYAFTWSKLTSIVIPDSVTSIGDDVFKSCSSLTSITIPNSVTRIGKETFYDCTGLTSIIIPDSVTSIEYGTFNLCSSLESIVIPNGVTSIEDYAFYDCTCLTSIVIPNSVTNIGVRSFAWCKNLTSITIPDSVTSIGYETFYGCSGLTSITIPDSVTRIEYWTFEECNNLTEIHYSGSATGFPWGAEKAKLITGSDEVDNEEYSK